MGHDVTIVQYVDTNWTSLTYCNECELDKIVKQMYPNGFTFLLVYSFCDRHVSVPKVTKPLLTGTFHEKGAKCTSTVHRQIRTSPTYSVYRLDKIVNKFIPILLRFFFKCC